MYNSKRKSFRPDLGNIKIMFPGIVDIDEVVI